MPRYVYKCRKCGRVEEKRVPITNSEALFFCTKCLTLSMYRQFSAKGIVFHIRWGKPKVRQRIKRMGA